MYLHWSRIPAYCTIPFHFLNLSVHYHSHFVYINERPKHVYDHQDAAKKLCYRFANA